MRNASSKLSEFLEFGIRKCLIFVGRKFFAKVNHCNADFLSHLPFVISLVRKRRLDIWKNSPAETKRLYVVFFTLFLWSRFDFVEITFSVNFGQRKAVYLLSLLVRLRSFP